MPNAHDVARVLGGATKTEAGWLCRCPVQGHGKGRGDRTPSLSVADGAKGLVWKCWAGCSQETVQAALERHGLADGPRHGDGRPVFKPRTPLVVAGSEANRAAAHRIWKAAGPAAGTGPVFVKVGSRVFYRPQDLDAWVETRLRRSTSEYEAA